MLRTVVVEAQLPSTLGGYCRKKGDSDMAAKLALMHLEVSSLALQAWSGDGSPSSLVGHLEHHLPYSDFPNHKNYLGCSIRSLYSTHSSEELGMYVRDPNPVYLLQGEALSNEVAENQRHCSSNDDGVRKAVGSPVYPLDQSAVLKYLVFDGPPQPLLRLFCFGWWDGTVKHLCYERKGDIKIRSFSLCWRSRVPYQRVSCVP